MTHQEYEAKLKSLHPQFDCDLIAKLKSDYITELEAKIPVWRKYPDEKPSKFKGYLVYAEHGFTGCQRQHSMDIIAWNAEKGCWHTMFAFRGNKYDVLYWLDIPEPPEATNDHRNH